MTRHMTQPPKNKHGSAWSRWLNQRMAIPGEGRNRNGICRCGAVREIHEPMPDDPDYARPEWGGREGECDLYEFAVRIPGGWDNQRYAARSFVIPNGTRVEYVGPAVGFRRAGEQFGIVDDPGDDRSDEHKFGPGTYKAYYVQWDSGKVHHVAHCDLKVVDASR